MQTLRRTQTQRSDIIGRFGLSVTGHVTSPYFCTDRNNRILNIRTMKALFLGFVSAGPTPGALVEVWDGTGTLVGDFGLPLSIGYSDTLATDYWSDISSGIVSGLAGNGVTIASSDIVYIDPILSTLSNPLPSSYQTIVTQTGTSAPTAGITPTSTYPSGTTFTWARTGAGVYTLTASTAVFSTTKTGVFVAPLQNLNASIKAVVTSTTVITVTTAVQSVATLGLLGLTTTNTDALLSSTMMYIQTYS